MDGSTQTDGPFGVPQLDSGQDVERVGDADAAGPLLPELTSPRDLTGLALWLDAGQGTTAIKGSSFQELQTWSDQSTNHENVTVGLMPALELTSDFLDQAKQKKVPLVTFRDLSHVTVATSNALDWGVEDFLVEAVVRPTVRVGVSGGPVWTTAFNIGASGAGIQLVMGGNVEVRVIHVRENRVVTIPVMAVPAHVIGVRRVGGSNLSALADGESNSIQVDPKVPATDPTQTMWLGSYVSANFPFFGSVAEAVIVRGPISDVDLRRLHGYFAKKYGLQIAGL
jgi:hypothetical protein